MRNSCFYREHQRELCYLKDAILVGKYRFPMLSPTQAIPQNVYSYTERKTVKDKQNSWLDFFIDDAHFIKLRKIEYIYIFRKLQELKQNPQVQALLSHIKYDRYERTYNSLERIIKSILIVKGVIGPDFSLYPEMPEIQRIYNCWRSRVVSYYMRLLGINVIPAISWGYMSDFEWCLDGMPPNSSVAISTNGCKSESYSKKMFLEGVEVVEDKLKPSHLIICGSPFKELEKYENITYYPSYSQRLYIKCKEKRLIKNKGQHELPFWEETECI